ncbi:hypothetical protein FJR38_25030 [Anabaena sp. UHCC 0253]|uniref:hypothetical protein n=1 Tax=Anabaena sp. UHCC 0253 TaxID=2590019 RepID=UPI001444E359|nr:hypothetical protein [Anabaena sp. UHCC 0253]MTJ55694.1 hypothetical protein [Anabaena sp. UHCC 0253]
MADLTPVVLADIESVERHELKDSKLQPLLAGSLDDALYKSSEPMRIDKTFGKPYRIINGRHRIYLCRQKGYKLVPAVVVG